MVDRFFISNRQRSLHVMQDTVIVLAAYSQFQRSNDAAFTFTQESNFWWLTGIKDPDWQVIIEPSGKTWLVAPRISSTHQIFDGSLSDEQALQTSGADGVLSKADAVQLLHKLAKEYKSVYTLGPDPHRKHFDFVENPAPARLRNRLKKLFTQVEDARPILSKLRALKQPHEIDAIQRAVDLTIDGFKNIKDKLENNELHYEYDIEAEFSYGFTKAGHHGHAYDPIVAFGKNACTLHYGKNNAKLSSGLVLMDVGARIDGYAADITRTFAVGEVTDRQRQVHHAVQTAHFEIIELLRPNVSVKSYLESVDQIMKNALSSLGLLNRPSDYRKYFPHAVSHGLGVDVHDSLGAPEVFLPNMVLTVEPGIYIPEEGIGVRIEDDILITSDGHRNLSGHLTTDL